MSDAAAFFAKKKKSGKKKSFKAFNANKIDATSVASAVHVDAPAVSSVAPVTSAQTTSSTDPSTSATPNLVEEEWAAPVQKAPAAAVVHPKRGTVTELLDMNALEVRRREQDDVVERMRVEETKAALTSARKGMEKEARRLKQEEEDKKKKAENPSSAPAAANGRGSSIGMGGGKWVAPHLRGGGGSASLGQSRLMMNKARGKTAGIDTKDDNDFPDLASANAAIEEQRKLEEEQKEKQRVRMANKKAGNSPWGNGQIKNIRSSNSDTRQPVKIAPSKKEIDMTPPQSSKKEETPAVAVAPISTAPVVKAPTATTTPETAPKPVIKKKKKKKKDLSTFQISS